MCKGMIEDIRSCKKRDPAAKSSLGIFINYSGLHAIWMYRFCHWQWTHHMKALARWQSQMTRHFTGVEIHPGATIGRRFFIDHGMGIVIGETTIIGDDCMLYQGSTLGGTGNETGKRHPTLGNGVIVGVGAAVLGNITIGDNVKIGGGAVVVNDVPPNCTVVGIPGHVVKYNGKKISATHPDMLRHEDLPDPLLDTIEAMEHHIDRLERRIIELERDTGVKATRTSVKPVVETEAALEEDAELEREALLEREPLAGHVRTKES